MDASKSFSSCNDIAIIGMDGVFPGSANLNEFWENLKAGKEMIKTFSKDELAHLEDKIKFDESFIPRKGVVNNSDLFDADFFNISPREAELLDPQHRVLLKYVWLALEDSFYDPYRYDGCISLFCSASPNSYFLNNLHNRHELGEGLSEFHFLGMNAADSIATRIAYKLNFRGAAMTVQSACSSSALSIFLACQSLNTYNSDIAIAAAASIKFPIISGYIYEPGGILSQTGHCRPFDVKADGTLDGDGVGVVVLKRFNQAIKDGDRIYAIIKGCGTNNDGSKKMSFGAPSAAGQKNCINDAILKSNISPESIGYIESHGTATALGDPVEFKALKSVYGNGKQPCYIGSIKANIGHLDVVAGIVGVIKTVLVLRNKQIPPLTNFEQPNKEITLSDCRLKFNTSLVDWDVEQGSRRAAISSFGVGGTNVHIVLEEHASNTTSNVDETGISLVLLSAKNKPAYEKYKDAMQAFIHDLDPQKYPDAAYSSQIGRAQFDYRAVYVLHANDITPSCIYENHTNKMSQSCIFVFQDEVSEGLSAVQEAYVTQSTYQCYMNLCHEAILLSCECNIITTLNKINHTEDSQQKVDLDNDFCKLLLAFSIQYIRARILIDKGVIPSICIGFGLGELVAACVSGIVSLEDAIKILVAKNIHNGELDRHNLYNSSLVNDSTEALDTLLENIKYMPCSYGFASLALPRILQPRESISHDYWHKFVMNATNYNSLVSKVTARYPNSVFLNLGDILNRSLIDTVETTSKKFFWLDFCLDGVNGSTNREFNSLHHLVARVWCLGGYINWDSFNSDIKYNKIDLPKYPFEEKKYFIEPLKRSVEYSNQYSGLIEKACFDNWFYKNCWLEADIHSDDEDIVIKDNTLIISEEGPQFNFVTDILKSNQIEYRYQAINDPKIIPSEFLDSIDKKGTIVVCLSDGVQDNDNILDNINWLTSIFKILYNTPNISKKLIRLIVITNGIFRFLTNDTVKERNAELISFCKVAKKELPSLHTSLIDLPNEFMTNDTKQMIYHDIYLNEHDVLSIYRHGHRWIESYQRVDIHSVGKSLLKKDNAYLITGGLGGMGFELAKYLFKQHNATIVLLHRFDPNNKNARKYTIYSKRYHELMKLFPSSKLKLLQCDISNYDEVHRALQTLIMEGVKINGVIHTAGCASGGILALKERQDYEAVFSAKVFGFKNLVNVLSNTEIDFFLTCSSLSAVLGEYGQADYAAANIFLDIYAANNTCRTNKKPKFISINWGVWNETGMACEYYERYKDNHLATRTGIVTQKTELETGINTIEGIKAFEIALKLKLPNLIVSPVSLFKLQKMVTNANLLPENDLYKNTEGMNTDSAVKVNGESNNNKNTDILCKLWCKTLGIKQINTDDSFYDLGGDSLTAIKLMQDINKAFGTSLVLQDILKYNTIALLEEAILSENVNG